MAAAPVVGPAAALAALSDEPTASRCPAADVTASDVTLRNDIGPLSTHTRNQGVIADERAYRHQTHVIVKIPVALEAGYSTPLVGVHRVERWSLRPTTC